MPATPRVRSVRGSKRTGIGISVWATKRPASASMETLALGTGARTGSEETPEKIARHGSVANSEYSMRPSRFQAL